MCGLCENCGFATEEYDEVYKEMVEQTNETFEDDRDVLDRLLLDQEFAEDMQFVTQRYAESGEIIKYWIVGRSYKIH